MHQKYGMLPYTVSTGEELTLGRWNMMQPSPYVSRAQCKVVIMADGTAILTSVGKPPTGIRARGGQWNALYFGQHHILSDGDQVSLDIYNNPEGAVLTLQNEGAMQQGGYQQQGYAQQGYPQQGYPQQGGYQQGGYQQY